MTKKPSSDLITMGYKLEIMLDGILAKSIGCPFQAR
jgi:hypothetical protein